MEKDRKHTVLEIALLEKVQLQNDGDAKKSKFLSSPVFAPHCSNNDFESRISRGDLRARMTNDAYFLRSDLFRKPAFGGLHPLVISRLGAVEDVCRLLGWLDATNTVDCPQASDATLLQFHDPDYVQALKTASANGAVTEQDRMRFNFGTMENPIFAGVAERAATTVGGSIRAAELALEGKTAVHFGGGTHHGRPGRASGFCYYNDPVFAIKALLEGGCSRVAYVDLDAHHGDGVEAAFVGDDRVFLASIHEADRWPHSGVVDAHAGGNAFNAPVPARLNDTEFAFLLNDWLLPAFESFSPEAVVIVCGADALHGDPLSRLEISNVALQNAVMEFVGRTHGAVVLGGGGYNPWTTVRAWAGLWARIAGYEAPASLPQSVVAMLASFDCDLVDEEDRDDAWMTTLNDAPNPGPVRDSVKNLMRLLLEK